jgi:uncharacterized protein YukE
MVLDSLAQLASTAWFDTRLFIYVIYLGLLFILYGKLGDGRMWLTKNIHDLGFSAGKFLLYPFTLASETALSFVTDKIVPLVTHTLETITNALSAPIKQAKKAFRDAYDSCKAAYEKVREIAESATKEISKQLDAAKNVEGSVLKNIADITSEGEKNVSALASRTMNFAPVVEKKLEAVAENALTSVSKTFDGKIKQVQNLVQDGLGSVGDQLNKIFKDIETHFAKEAEEAIAKALESTLQAGVQIESAIANAVVSNPVVQEASNIINNIGDLFKRKNHDNNGPCGVLCTPVQVWKDFSGANRCVKFIQTFEKDPGKCDQPNDIMITPTMSDSIAVQTRNACNTKFLILHENGDVVNTKTHHDGFDMPYTNENSDTYDAARNNRHSPSLMYTSRLFKLSQKKWDAVRGISPRDYGSNTQRGRRTVSGAWETPKPHPIDSFLQDTFLHAYLSNPSMAEFCNKLPDDAFEQFLGVHHGKNICDTSIKLIRQNINKPSVQNVISSTMAAAGTSKSRSVLNALLKSDPSEFNIGGDIYSLLYTTFLDLKQFRNRFRYSEYGWPIDMNVIHVSIEAVPHISRNVYVRGHMDKTTDVNSDNQGEQQVFPFIRRTMRPVRGTGGVFTLNTDSGSANASVLYVFMCTNHIMLLIWDSEVSSGRNYRIIGL